MPKELKANGRGKRLRPRKPAGHHKLHTADQCGICAKPRTYRRKKRDAEIEKAGSLSETGPSS